MSLYHEAQQLKETIIANRHYLHQIPELGLNLPQTADFVEAKLREMGYEPQRIGDCGIVALAGKGEGKCFVIRPTWMRCLLQRMQTLISNPPTAICMPAATIATHPCSLAPPSC